MGQKGAKLTEQATKIADNLLKDLSALGDVTMRKMFGGFGVFESGKMFALIDSNGVVHFKADDANRDRFEKADSKQHGKMPYFEVPADVLKSKKKLHDWAQTSIAAAHTGKK